MLAWNDLGVQIWTRKNLSGGCLVICFKEQQIHLEPAHLAVHPHYWWWLHGWFLEHLFKMDLGPPWWLHYKQDGYSSQPHQSTHHSLHPQVKSSWFVPIESDSFRAIRSQALIQLAASITTTSWLAHTIAVQKRYYSNLLVYWECVRASERMRRVEINALRNDGSANPYVNIHTNVVGVRGPKREEKRDQTANICCHLRLYWTRNSFSWSSVRKRDLELQNHWFKMTPNPTVHWTLSPGHVVDQPFLGWSVSETCTGWWKNPIASSGNEKA